MVHDGHDRVLVPPIRLGHDVDRAPHDDDLAGRHELAAGVGGSEMRRNARGRDVAAEGLGQPVDHLAPLARRKGRGRARGQDKVAVEVDDQGVGRGREETPALGRGAEDVRSRLLHELLQVAGVHDGHVQTAPLVDPDAEADRLGRDGEHGRVVADEDDATGRRQGGLDDADDVGDREAREQRPRGKVLEAGGRGRELVAERVVLHVDAHEVVEAGGREAQDARDLLGVEQVRGLVPVDPHAPEVVAEQVVQRVARQEAQAVGYPVPLVSAVEIVRLGASTQVADRLGALLVGAGPDAEGDAVQGLGRVLLQHEGVVHAVRLRPSGADLDVVGETSLRESS